MPTSQISGWHHPLLLQRNKPALNTCPDRLLALYVRKKYNLSPRYLADACHK